MGERKNYIDRRLRETREMEKRLEEKEIFERNSLPKDERLHNWNTGNLSIHRERLRLLEERQEIARHENDWRVVEDARYGIEESKREIGQSQSRIQRLRGLGYPQSPAQLVTPRSTPPVRRRGIIVTPSLRSRGLHLRIARLIWLPLALTVLVQAFMLIHSKDVIPYRTVLFGPVIELGHNPVPVAVLINFVTAVMITIAAGRLSSRVSSWPRSTLAWATLLLLVQFFLVVTHYDTFTGWFGLGVLGLSAIQLASAGAALLFTFSSDLSPRLGTRAVIHFAADYSVSRLACAVVAGGSMSVTALLLYTSWYNESPFDIFYPSSWVVAFIGFTVFVLGVLEVRRSSVYGATGPLCMGITVALAATGGAILFFDITQTLPLANDYGIKALEKDIENDNMVVLASLGLLIAGIAALIGLIRRLTHR